MLGIALRDIKQGEYVFYDVDLDPEVHAQNRPTWSQWVKAFDLIGYKVGRHVIQKGNKYWPDGGIEFVARPENNWGPYKTCGTVRMNYGHETGEILELESTRFLIDLYVFTKKSILWVDGKGPDPSAEKKAKCQT